MFPERNIVVKSACDVQVQISTTRLFLSSMTNVLRETSQDREYLNRLRAFGLADLSDAYLVSIDTSDGYHVRPHKPLSPVAVLHLICDLTRSTLTLTLC